MPKDRKASRIRAVVAPTRVAPGTRAEACSAQPVRPFLQAANGLPRPSNQRTQQRHLALPSLIPENHPRENTEEVSSLVHADCIVVFEKADRDRRQLTAQLEKSSDAARKSNVEKVQSNAQVRKLTSELNQSKHKILDLERHLDKATLDSEKYVTREKHEKTLRALLGASSSVIKMIASKISASKKEDMGSFMSPFDVAQGPWADQSDQFAMLDNPVVPDNMSPMLSTSDPLADLPDFDMYEALP